jgi:hypothetical protein
MAEEKLGGVLQNGKIKCPAGVRSMWNNDAT